MIHLTSVSGHKWIVNPNEIAVVNPLTNVSPGANQAMLTLHGGRRLYVEQSFEHISVQLDEWMDLVKRCNPPKEEEAA